jgi:menaquinone-dependent protoporphyrinogen IX oxidase
MTSSKKGKRILVAYATQSGSTAEIAQVIGEELAQMGAPADVRPLEELHNLEAYDPVIVGGPMMIGWHRAAGSFIKRHQEALRRVRVAYFFTAMSLTQPEEADLGSVPIYVDSALGKPHRNPKRRSMRELYTTVPNYLNPVMKIDPRIQPVSAGFFAGKIDLSKLNILQKFFVLWIIGARPADKRNWPAIREWASDLRNRFLQSNQA